MGDTDSDIVEQEELVDDLDEIVRETTMSDADIDNFYTTKTFRVVHQNNNSSFRRSKI